ncbi:hypothetical protein GPY61_31525 [Massilia sp. NEAU-DD11]|uniref:Uncharacterized protein n=1 Tax=Massilia cellulosiltytica TaxID=2683234 RepID=A0A7X3KB95_9BURK|nr:hypothetical protein [Telluria cellulosilytica]MVW64457.1 hypothetical protein [Telluria cellulosilytica]
MSEPRTTREALIAQMLGDLDGLLTRVEQLPKAIAEAETRLASASRVLNDASDKYRIAVTVFTEEAKRTLTEYLEQKASQVGTLTVEERRAVIEDAVRYAYRIHASRSVAQHKSDRDGSASADRLPAHCRLLEHGVTAVLASVLTAALVLVVVVFG